MKIYNFLYQVNLYKISQYFIEEDVPESPFYTYRSKNFYGATIRSEREIEDYQYDSVLLAIRFKGHGYNDGTFERLTGIKMDIIGDGDRRMKELSDDIDFESLDFVTMEIDWKTGHISMTDVDEATLLLSVYDRKADRTGTITFIPML